MVVLIPVSGYCSAPVANAKPDGVNAARLLFCRLSLRRAIEDNLASIQSPMYKKLCKSAEYLEEDFDVAEDEDWD